jgi:serine/threonine protein kinase
LESPGLVQNNLSPFEKFQSSEKTFVSISPSDDLPLSDTTIIFKPYAQPKNISILGKSKFIGTLGFISPEQIKNPSYVDFRSDIYSLGCTFFYFLTGKTVIHENSPKDAILKHENGNLPSLLEFRSDIPPVLESVYKKMVARNPKDRFQTIPELIEELEKVRTKPKIFISYRREDTIDATDRLFTSLIPKFGLENLFMDIDTIPPGVDFREFIKNEVSHCDILLAVIGDHWLRIIEDGTRRIDNPADFVRIEIESALELKIPIIPILVGQAQMLRPTELPQSIQEFAYRNSAEVRPGKNYEGNISQLAKAILSIFRDGI